MTSSTRGRKTDAPPRLKKVKTWDALPRKRIGYDLEKNKCEIVFYSIGKDL